VAAYNFIQPRSTLSWRFDKQSGKKYYIPTTPAMAAGLTSRPEIYYELLCQREQTKALSIRIIHHPIFSQRPKSQPKKPKKLGAEYIKKKRKENVDRPNESCYEKTKAKNWISLFLKMA
jgi:hypothetical protein